MSGKRAVGVCLVLGLALVAAASGDEVPSLDVELDLQPAAEHEGGYRCAAVLRDSVSGQVLSAPTIAFVRGEEAQVVSQLGERGMIRLAVLVSQDELEVSYRVEVVIDDVVVTSQRATIRL